MMLDRARQILSPSARSDVPPFMVMDVIAAATRVEAAGHHVIHMEVGQPAAPAPRTAIEAARRALGGPLRYTEALGIGSLRARIARHYGDTYNVDLDPARRALPDNSYTGAEYELEAIFCCARVGIDLSRRRRNGRRRFAADEGFGFADGQAARDDFARHAALRGLVGE